MAGSNPYSAEIASSPPKADPRNDESVMLTERQKKLLHLIIESYIKEARPVASECLVRKVGAKVSSATIRNDMAELEKAGYIEQPHTSAGRVPTVKGYEFYIKERVIKNKFQNSKSETQIKFKIQKSKDERQKIKEIAKWIAEESGLAVIAGFGESDNYYTGLSGLFVQPEFTEQATVVNVSALVEKFDIIVKEIYPSVGSEPGILIGRKSQLGKTCSFIVVRAGAVIIVILGPTRMDYKKNYQLIREAAKLIAK